MGLIRRPAASPQLVGDEDDASPLLAGSSSSSCSSGSSGGGADGRRDASSLVGAAANGGRGSAAAPLETPAGPAKSRLRNVSGFDLPAPTLPAPAPPASAAPAAEHTSASWAYISMLTNNGVFLALVAYLVFAISAFSVKLTHGRVPVLELCLVRSALSFGMCVALMRGMRISPMFGKRSSWPLLIARGCFGSMGMVLYYVSIQLVPLGDAVTLGLIQPPITAVLARLVLGEPLGIRGAMGCLVSLAGVVFICQPPFLFGGGTGGAADAATRMRLLGSAAGLTAAVLSAFSFLAIRKLGAAEKAPVVAMAFHTASLTISSGPLLAGWPQKARVPEEYDAGLLVGVAVTSFFAQLLMTRALQLTAAARVSSTSFTQVIYSYGLSMIFFHQKISLVSAAGVLCTLAGVALVVLRHSPAPRPPPVRPEEPVPMVAKSASVAAPSLPEAPSLGSMILPAEVSFAERLLSKQASAAVAAPAAAAPDSAQQQSQQQQAAEGVQGEGGAAAGLEPEQRRAYLKQRSLRAIESIRRMSVDITEGGAAAARSLMNQIGQISAAAAAQMVQQPSMTMADLAMAAEGACSACTAALAALTAAYEAASAADDGDAAGAAAAETQTAPCAMQAVAAAAAAEVVAAAFRGDEPQASSGGVARPGGSGSAGGGLIPAVPAMAVRSSGQLSSDEPDGPATSDDLDDASEGLLQQSKERSDAWPAAAAGAQPRMSSQLLGQLDEPLGCGSDGGGMSGGLK